MRGLWKKENGFKLKEVHGQVPLPLTSPPFDLYLGSSLSKDKFGLVQDGIYALGKAPYASILSLRSFPNVASETLPMFA